MMKISDLYDGRPRLCVACGDRYPCRQDTRNDFCELEPEAQAEERAWYYGPATEAALRIGCTCRYATVHATDIDPPEPIRNKWCPLHGGADPDDLRDEDIERAQKRLENLFGKDWLTGKDAA